MAWKSIPLSDCLIAHEVGRANQINTADIQPVGRFPVVDQGQAYIAGYTDDTKRVIRDGLPYVIFGDHTRCFKYVDFPFVLGADGTKVLKPNPQLFDTRFFYYAVLTLDIPSRGYNRHFTLLREKLIPRPALEEQRQIALILSAARRAIERQEKLIALTIELKRSLMQKLFTEGTRGEPVKETEFGLVPESWRLERVGVVCRSIVPGRNKPRVFDGDIPWLTTPEIKELTYITASLQSRRVSRRHLDEIGGRIVPANSVIMTCLGEFGIAAINLVPVVVNQQLHAFVCPSDLNPYFLCQMLRMRSTYMERIAHKTTVPYLNKSKCESVPIAIPLVREQNEIAAVLQRVDARVEVARRHKQCIEGLFRALLDQLMTAQIRVNDLDLSALEEAAQPEGTA